MTSLNHAIVMFIGIRWNLVTFLALILFGVCFTSAESHAQTVPPRGQTLQMIRPVAPPPEPPIQKEIRGVREELKNTGRQLQREIVERTLKDQGSVGHIPKKPTAMHTPQSDLSKDEKIKSLEQRVQELRNELANISRRVKDLEK